MLTINNYFDKTRNIDINTLHPTLLESHEWIRELTNDGVNWNEYRNSNTIKEVVDLHLQQMDLYLKKDAAKVKQHTPKHRNTEKSEIKFKSTESTNKDIAFVSRIPEELRFIKRFLNMHNKTQTKTQLLSFINSLQKAIVEQRIRKTSQWADQIIYLQKNIVSIYNSMGDTVKTVLKPDTLKKFKHLIDNEKVLPSVGVIKRYIGLHRKTDAREKAVNLLAHIDRSFYKGHIGQNDPYLSDVEAIQSNLQHFVSDKRKKALVIEPATLNGLRGILNGLEGCSCNSELSGLESQPQIISSVDFVRQQYPTIGFKGKYKDFIGDPSPGFTAMVFAKPKFGKSTLCTDFAGYIARIHGKVLYVAKEEGFSKTLQDKLRAVQHPRLMVTDFLPKDLSQFQYVFLDSVTRLQLTPDDLRRLKTSNPDICFIFVFQVTKNGQFRGANDFQHDVDVVIELPTPGTAIQFGRYNQGGTMNVFDKDEGATLLQ